MTRNETPSHLRLSPRAAARDDGSEGRAVASNAGAAFSAAGPAHPLRDKEPTTTTDIEASVRAASCAAPRAATSASMWASGNASANFNDSRDRATSETPLESRLAHARSLMRSSMGDFKNNGREWQPMSTPERALVHDFPQDAKGKAIPYGVYDMGRNEAWVTVGCDHDTPTFAVASIRRWWDEMGKARYVDAQELYITADAGGSNGYRSRAWKCELQKFADDTGLKIHVSHFPPGTSKWNKIEHRLFCHITGNWRGKPLRTFETIVDLIGNTRTAAGLHVQAEMDEGKYPTGVKTTDAEMEALSLHKNEFRGDWNYELHPRPTWKD